MNLDYFFNNNDDNYIGQVMSELLNEKSKKGINKNLYDEYSMKLKKFRN